ncbi:putative sulfate exporter family transporter [Trichococcus sp. K1Tr]|uniref:YeiH family protein n=1 Tax=Trichococcus sp. K1Tr TaxID=3020847 RepID=UPI00232EDB93|nr:putative sulfate exporter family transporter [Trichococcus sp. K1Tr]MDB6353541.1 putative sulfate exporter family transporter [Trichococcus sp. K1Tr]
MKINAIKKELDGILPGLAVSILISLASQFLARFLPTLGAALIAILLGMLLGNTLLNRPELSQGTKFSEKRLLEYAIVLNGLILDFQVLKSAGLKGFVFIILQISLTIFVTYNLGKYFGFGKRFALLMGAGNAVCGSSAIGTVSPIVKADNKEKGISITIVNLTGTALMILLPVLGAILYGSDTLRTSALIGGTVQSVGQVVAAAKLVNDEVVTLATVFKLMRVLLIIVVAVLYGRMNMNEGESLFTRKKRAGVDEGSVTGVGASANPAAVSYGVPWFLTGFVVFFLIRSFIGVPEGALVASKAISTQFEVAALAAIGMRVKFADIIKEGPKAMLYGLTVGAVQVVMAVALIRVFFG